MAARTPNTSNISRYLTISCMGDSQTQAEPVFAVRASRMWPELFAEKMRKLGVPVKARSFAVYGETTPQMLSRCTDMLRWEMPTIGVINAGVNDPGFLTLPSITPVSTGGSIAPVGGALYYAVAFVAVKTGFNLMAPVQAVLMPAGSTGSIVLGAITLPSTITAANVYISPTGYATAALAAAADTRTFLLAASMTAAATTITAIPSGTAACPSVSTKANIQAIAKMLKYNVRGFGIGVQFGAPTVATQTALPAYQRPGTRMIVMDDVSATGGLAARPNTTQVATIAGSFAGNAQQSVWEARTPQAGESGWGRIAISTTPPFADGCQNVIILSCNYLNFAASAGDNIDLSTGFAFNEGTSTDSTSAGTYYTLYVGVRAQTAAAAAAEGAQYADLFTFESGLIKAGETTQGSNSWHSIAGNQHHNPYGHDNVATVLVSTAVTAGLVNALAYPGYAG